MKTIPRTKKNLYTIDDFLGNEAFSKDSQEKLFCDWEKMSKSKYNGIEPNSIIEKYGIDTTRLFLLHKYSPFSSVDWDTKSKCFWFFNLQARILGGNVN